MPKVDGLDKSIRIAMLADELDPDAAPQDIEPVKATAPPVVAPAVAPPTEMAGLVQLLAAALQQNNTGTAEAIRDGLAANAAMSRNPIAESYLNGGFPDKGVFNHPAGGEFNTVLRCPMFLGVFNEKGAITPAFEIYGKSCTERERVLLNSLTPGSYLVERNDDQTAHWRLVQESDDLGQPIRFVIAVPQQWLSKDQQRAMPSQIKFLKQLTDAATVAA